MLRCWIMVEVEWRVALMRFRVCFLFRSVGNVEMVNLRPAGALRWKAEDHRFGRAGSVM
jgi:hypothetical protein